MYGHPEGLHGRLVDSSSLPRTAPVSSLVDLKIGLYTSVVFANRLNLFWGLDWGGLPEALHLKRKISGGDIVIGAFEMESLLSGRATDLSS